MKTINLIIFSIIIILSSCSKYDEFPVVKTIEVSNITSDAFNCGGIITISGGSDINNYGLCWSTNSKPTIKDSTKSSNKGETNFTISVTGLIPNTNYYVCAFASNKNGTSYGEVKKITTEIANIIINTNVISNISFTSASSGGNIINDGGSNVTSRGICWSLTSNPTVMDNKTINGSGIGNFNSNITGLLPNTTYYVRAYGINVKGISYGNLITFKTNSLSIGDSYYGGIVAYILQPSDSGYSSNIQHGLIAASTDLTSINIPWDDNQNKRTKATSTKYGTGKQNTNTIINIIGSTSIYAAKLCKDYNGGSSNDWFLPSEEELNKLYLNRNKIGGFIINGHYWSSSESDFIWSNALYLDFTDGITVASPKWVGKNVRPVRYF